MAKKRSHPLDSLTFAAPKLDAPQDPAVPSVLAPTHPSQTAPEEASRSSNVTLPIKVWEWIDTKHAEARRNGGKPLRKAAIIRAVFEVIMVADVDLAGVQSEEELTARLLRAVRQ
jgi:hypothetical protein